jgi:hypothetical protein
MMCGGNVVAVELFSGGHQKKSEVVFLKMCYLIYETKQNVEPLIPPLLPHNLITFSFFTVFLLLLDKL